MSFLTGSMGEPQEEQDHCDSCWARIKKAVNCPTFACARDGSEEAVEACWKNAHSKREDFSNG